MVKANKWIVNSPRIVPELIRPDLVGTHCIAKDEHYGTYKAVILGGFRGNMEVRIGVRILECIRRPSQKAILNSSATCRRNPYPNGSVQIFSMDQIKPLLEVTA